MTYEEKTERLARLAEERCGPIFAKRIREQRQNGRELFTIIHDDSTFTTMTRSELEAEFRDMAERHIDDGDWGSVRDGRGRMCTFRVTVELVRP